MLQVTPIAKPPEKAANDGSHEPQTTSKVSSRDVFKLTDEQHTTPVFQLFSKRRKKLKCPCAWTLRVLAGFELFSLACKKSTISPSAAYKPRSISSY